LSSHLTHLDDKPKAPRPPLIGALLRMPWEAVHERMLASLRQRGFEDLIAPHLTVLQYPGPEDARPSDLAARTRMSKQALNYLLGQMEELGYLERVPDEADQRFKRIRLTPRGRAASAAMRAIVLEIEAEWTSKLGPARFAELRRLLEELGEDGSAPDPQTV
jgi:DNA-binding MarR family transcriptional regulator